MELDVHQLQVWKMVQRQLECVDVIRVNEPIKQLEVHGKIIFIVSQGHGRGIKVLVCESTV